MKFAHMADCHIGSWRDPQLRELSSEAFKTAIAQCIEEKVDFLLIAGDLFHTAIPGIEHIRSAVKELKRLKDAGIPVYIIAGSHDYSPSGKTMIDVLEEAGLVLNVVKGSIVDGKLHLKLFTDKKTGVKIAGMLGKRGTLEKQFYESLDKESLEKEKGFKIFLFHSAITELMPKELTSIGASELSYLPKGFDYYAGGHVHIVKEYTGKDYKNVIYPGPLFPDSFAELEKLGNGGFYIYDNGKLIRKEVLIKKTAALVIDAEHKSPEEVEEMIAAKIHDRQFTDTIVLLRIAGRLKTGKVSDINFRELFRKINAQGAFFILKNTHKLLAQEFEEIKIEEKSIAELEDALVREHLGQAKITGVDTDKEFLLAKKLIAAFETEKHEGEKVYEYEDRVRKAGDKILEL